MGGKATYAIAIMFTLLISSAWRTLSFTTVTANPIPTPALIMPDELIDITFRMGDDALLAKVDGAYGFLNFDYIEVAMDYPLPPNATEVSVAEVTVDWEGTPLAWAFSSKLYPTMLGDWPMINWTISSAHYASFIVRTHYEHVVPLVFGNYTFIYALGTGRYLATYYKETTAYINMRMEMNYTCLQVYTAQQDVNGVWLWIPVEYTVVDEDGTDVVTLVFRSDWEPLVEDVLVTFNVEPLSPGDLNNDGKCDIRDLSIATKAFGTHPSNPRWNSLADTNKDLRIDIKDIAFIAKNFGKTYP